MSSPGTRPAAALAAPTAEQIADVFDLLARASRWLREELDEIAVCRTPLSQTSVDRLVAVGRRMRPAAAARTRLAHLDPALLLAGVAVWVNRQPPADTDPDLAAAGAGGTAAARARLLWAAGGAE